MSDDNKQCFKLCSSGGVPCTCPPTTGWNYIVPEPDTSQLKEIGDELKAPSKPTEWTLYSHIRNGYSETHANGPNVDWVTDEHVQVIEKSAYLELQAERDELKAQRMVYKSENSDLRAEVERLKRELETERAGLMTWCNAAHEYKAQLAASSAEVERLKDEHKAAINDADFYIKKLEAQLAAVTSEVERSKEWNKHRLIQHELLTLDTTIAENERDGALEREAELQAQVERLEAITDRYDAELSESGDRNVSHMIEIKKLQAQLAAMTSDYEQLEKVYRMNREWIADAKEREALLLKALRWACIDDQATSEDLQMFAREALEAHAKLVGGNK